MKVDGRYIEVAKQGFLSGSWNFVEGGSVIASAQKRNAFMRSFDVRLPSGSFVLEASTFATRGMKFYGPGADASIAPAHPFTRRASIDGSVPNFEVAAIAFWLTALTWRRAANNNAAAG